MSSLHIYSFLGNILLISIFSLSFSIDFWDPKFVGLGIWLSLLTSAFGEPFSVRFSSWGLGVFASSSFVPSSFGIWFLSISLLPFHHWLAYSLLLYYSSSRPHAGWRHSREVAKLARIKYESKSIIQGQ